MIVIFAVLFIKNTGKYTLPTYLPNHCSKIVIPETEISLMEKILKTPGLVHLAENIFNNLSDEAVKICRCINQSSMEILDNISFWLRKFGNLSKENQKEWMKVIKSVKKSEKQKAIITYLQWNLKKKVVDFSCYSSPAAQDDFSKKILQLCGKSRLSDEDTEIIKVLAPLTVNHNAQNRYGCTSILRAALSGHTEIVKILAPLTDNPNAPDKFGGTPIYWAALKGHTEIVKILAPLCLL